MASVEANSAVSELFRDNPIIWGKYFFPHYFRKRSPDFHIKILETTIANKLVAIAAPRSSAKSTIETFLMSIHGICFGYEKFIIILQNTAAKAFGSLESIKSEVRNNKGLVDAYGVVLTKDAEGDSVFQLPDGSSCRVLAKGADQLGSIRGEKFGAYRPSLVIVDDLEDDEEVKNAERRLALEQTFNDVVNYIGEYGETRIVVGGTILHDDSLLAKLVSNDKYRDFKKLFFTAIKEDGTSLWPEKWSVEQLNKMERSNPKSYAKEMMNNPVSGLARKFLKEDFRYWKIIDGGNGSEYVLYNEEGDISSKGSLSLCRSAIACDLAWETKRESDFSVILPGYMTPQNELLIDSYVCKKGLRPDEYEESVFQMVERLEAITGKSVPIGLEKAKLEKVMRWWLSKAMQRRNKYLLLKDLVWDTDKLQRIYTRLQPRYANHAIYHKHGMGELELQLLRIPSGTHDDLVDAEQGLVQLLSYRKHDKKVEKTEDAFEWWRDTAIKARQPKERRDFQYGQKGISRWSEIPAQKAWR